MALWPHGQWVNEAMVEEHGIRLRACPKIPRDAVSEQRADGETRQGEYASWVFDQGAAGLLAVGCVGSVVTARYGDAPSSPPCPPPKSLAAAPLAIFGQALRHVDPGSQSAIARWQVCSSFRAIVVHYMKKQ